MPSHRRTTTAAVTAKNRSRKNSPKHFVGCPCKKCTTFKHDPTCTCKECGFHKLLTKVKMRSRGRKLDGGRVYLGMIDDESYYSPPVVAAAAAAPPAPLPVPVPVPAAPPAPLPAPVPVPAVPVPGAGTYPLPIPPSFPTYDEICGFSSSQNQQLKDLIISGGGTPESGTGSFKKNQNLLIQMYYTGRPLIP